MSIETCQAIKLHKGFHSCTDTKIALYIMVKNVKVPVCMRHWLKYCPKEKEIDTIIGNGKVRFRKR